MILALSSKSRLPLSRKGRERGEGDGYRGWGIREENSRAKAGARVSPRPGRATRCACARSIRCRSWRLIGRPLPDKSRSRSCRSERGRAAIRGLSARLVYSRARRYNDDNRPTTTDSVSSSSPLSLESTPLCRAPIYIAHVYTFYIYT